MASSETPTVFAMPMASSEIPDVDSHNQNYPENPISGSPTHNFANAVETDTPVLDSEKQHHAEKPLAGNQTPPNFDQTFPTGSAQRYIADINGLVPTKTIHFHIVVCVMTIWKMIEKKKKNVKSVELALIDAQGSKIQATIPARIIKDFQKYFLQEGCARKISRFDHCLNISGGYRCSKHEYKIVFRPDTLVQSVGYHDIPNHVFEFTPFAEITNFVANFDFCFGKDNIFQENLTGGKQRSAFGKRLDVSDYNIRNNTSAISVARVTTDADVIRKYLDAVSNDQEIDPELSAEFCHNLTPLSESTAKTAVSCTDDNDMGTPGDETGDSPPPKKHASAQCGEESVKSQPNKRVRKL
ncbi:OLC1v1013125C1 [Oldenlandia corymbosa var. corymbosa]|uniref:OLC1v1013125C1 n=1 Tax=Oldenlandia corymbosa var. corymbosa TaxID=529605 RepID=A0AAV1DZI8_OLDCO|nr:OLC1v1013125C1 [Oldenlandia corymbosa var. corymbosa]